MLNSFSAARQTKSKQSLETGDVNVKSFVGYRWDIEGQRPLCAEAIWIYENLFIFSSFYSSCERGSAGEQCKCILQSYMH